MAIYLFLFSIIGFFALDAPRLSAGAQRQLVALFCVVMWLIAATRDRVGGDWYQYIDQYLYISRFSLQQSLGYFEPGWVVINRLAAISNTGVYGVNAIACLVGMVGIYLMCAVTARPMLALVCSFPYMYLVVMMGFVRQSIAMGFFAIAIYLYEKNRKWFWVTGCCACGLLFHSSAVFAVMFVLAGAFLTDKEGNLSKPRLLFFVVVQLLMMSYFIARFGFGDKYDAYSSYDYNPSASRARAFYNLCIFLLWPAVRMAVNSPRVRVLGDVCMYSSILGFIGVWFFPLIFDRLIIYFLPLHLLIIGNVRLGSLTGLFRKSLVFVFGAYLVVWLAYANNASSWVPYQSILDFGVHE